MTDGPSVSVISQIADELTSEEKKALLYMCADLNLQAPAQDVKEVLKMVTNRNDLAGQAVLLELIYRIKRFDLLKRLLRSTKTEVEVFLGSKQSAVSMYRVLMADISEELDRGDLQSLIFLLTDSLPRGRLSQTKSFLDLVIELEKCGKVSAEQLELIEGSLQKIHRMDLAKKVLKYKQNEQIHRAGGAVSYPKQKSQYIPQAHGAGSDPRSPVGAGCTPFGTWDNENLKMSVEESGFPHSQNPGIYKLLRRPLGVCLIIDSIGIDGDILRHTFEKLHFRVVLHKWLGLQDTYLALTETARLQEHKEADAFACCIISRGFSSGMLATNSEGPGLHFEDVRRLFSAKQCPFLMAKPKLFFIQNYAVQQPGGYFTLSTGDLEVDGYSHAAEVEPILTEADLCWSYSRCDTRTLEIPGHHSEFLCTLSAELISGQKRQADLLDVLTDVKSATNEKNCHNLKDFCYVSLQHSLVKKFVLQ
ncbi:CASP8 and FADD-like apoptosis regulator [Polypterus senegalus]|uniref:CASP8 and FADD-like apoptosis regulator n=1 Tax=Polypterus senegalus TaxID=55291 RepID=UPI00196292DB|nr:CASP8 and FADD-like apoptosis regulator [Polypterus senegalus]